MAPNMITLLGLIFIIINALTVLYYDPYLNEESPRWTYFSYALGLFLYQTFDACDGNHARRTGQSGPLGELFDHCIDSLNTTLSMFPVWSTIGLGYSNMFILSHFACLCNFYLSTWEEYHTNVLYLSVFSGPVEGITMLIVLFVLTGVYGQRKVWRTCLFDIPLNDDVFKFQTVHLFLCFAGVALISNILAATTNVSNYYREKNKKSEKPKSKKAVDEEISTALDGLTPFFAYFLTVFTAVLLNRRFVNFPFTLSIGFSTAFIVGRIIVNHLTLQPFPSYNPPLYIPLVQIILYLVITDLLHYDQDKVVFALTWLGCGVALGMHFLFINDIIYEFTQYLDIYALSIKHPKKENKKRA